MTTKGYKQPPEIRKKHSDALKKGQYFRCWVCNKEFWRKQSHIKKGDNKFCSRAHYFEWQKGKPKKISHPANKNGVNNPNWRGGITPIHSKLRKTEELKEWRQKVFERDNWTCQKCGARSKANEYIRIEAHHIKPFAAFPELRLVIDNGLTLCKRCHDKEPKGKEIWLLTNL